MSGAILFCQGACDAHNMWSHFVLVLLNSIQGRIIISWLILIHCPSQPVGGHDFGTYAALE